MGKIKIVTDSACDLDRELAKKYNLEIIPIPVQIGDENFISNGDSFFSEAHDLLLLNLDYQREMFSSMGLALMAETNQGALMAIPYFSEDLGGGVELLIQGTMGYDGDDMVTPGFGFNLSYYF